MRLSALQHLKMIHFREELIELYSCRLLRAFALSLIGVFIPIYLLELGFSFEMVMFYLVTKYSVLGLISPFSAWIETKIGVKHTTLMKYFK